MKEKLPKKKKANLLSREPYKRRKESEMIKIVREVHNGIITKRAACLKYGLNRNTLALFIRRFSVRNLVNDLPNQLLSNMTEDQKSTALVKKVKELEMALDVDSVHADPPFRNRRVLNIQKNKKIKK